MSRTWWIRITTIVVIMIWGTYMLLPTFLAESAQERLARQAEDAESSTAAKKNPIEERLPEASKLPFWLKEDILSEVQDCQSACNGLNDDSSADDSSEWARQYFTVAGKNAQSLCAKKLVSIPEKDQCAIDGLKSCTAMCNSDLDIETVTDPSSEYGRQACLTQAKSLKQKPAEEDPRPESCADGEQAAFGDDGWVCVAELGEMDPDLYSDIGCKSYLEKSNQSFIKMFELSKEVGCADACLSLHNEEDDAPDWAASFYAETVNQTFGTCMGETSTKHMEAETCIDSRARACTKACRDAGEEELSFSSKSVLAMYPEARLSLGLDLQGGIDLDLEVDIEEAVVSSVQRDIDSVKKAFDIEGIALDDVRRDQMSPVLLILPSEGTGLNSISGFMDNEFRILDGTPKYVYQNTRGIKYEGVERDFVAFRITEAAAADVSKNAIEQALETLRSRIDETGVKEPSIVLKGGNRINVQLPGIDNVQQAMSAIGTAAVLEFMMVDEKTMEKSRDLNRAILDAEQAMDPTEYKQDNLLSAYLVEKEQIPNGSKLMWEYKPLPEGGKARDPNAFYVVFDEVMLTGEDINDANVSYNQFNEPYVGIEFKPRGAQVFSEVTGENVGRRFAIVLDKEVRSAPVIREKIAGGRASIEMGVGDFQMAMQEANVLSLVLRTGALPAPVTVGKVRTVGASLGADAIDAGKRATGVGFMIVLLFMVLRYGKSGMVSVIALVCNVILVFALLATAGATLTLPGIAGIALTIGMAVDCNIIIYERIREEHKLGKNVRAAVSSGFDKAFLAVLDANITTFIAGVVLYTYGTGPIKGFAVTLMIGIMTTLFTGVFVSRTLMDFLTRKTSSRLSI